MRAELADGRVLDFPDGTDPAVIEATVKKLLAPPPSNTAVAVNAGNKGLAGIPDAVLNTPTNVINLAKAAVGVPMAAMGRPDLAPEPSNPPNYASRAMKAMGFIRDEAEPQTSGQRVLDTAVQGGVGGLVAPARTGVQAVTNALLGTAGGTSAGVTKEVTGDDNLAMVAGMGTQFAPAAAQRAIVGGQKPMNEVKAQTLQNARDAGYVVPGSETNTGWVNRRLEDFAGKAAVGQAAAAKNQETTTRNIAKDVGVDAESVTPGALAARRYEASEPYREVAALSPAAAKNLEMLKQVRSDANAHYEFYKRHPDPETLKKAKALSAQAEMIEGVIDQIAKRRGDPDLLDRLKIARQEVAKTFDAERSLNLGSGEVSAPEYGRMLDHGKKLSGQAEVTAKFAQAFPKYAREGATVPQADVSKMNAIASALLGTAGSNVGFQAGGIPGAALGASAAAIPFLANPTRNLITSKAYQKLLASSGKPLTEAQIRALMVGRAVAERD